jgi:ABC-type bacteriocin/lantibiotic exporter with double-glycine peptidase domain
VLQSFTVTVDAAMTTIMTLINITFFINFAGQPLLPKFIVYAIGFYMRLCNSIGFNFTRAFITTINMKVSIDRVQEFLMIPELVDERRVANAVSDKKLAVQMDHFSYKWNNEDDFGIKDASLRINKGEFAGIVGPVGSGKV